MFLEEVVDKCHNNLLKVSSKVPLAYLVSRGISLEDIKRYKIGYLEKSFDNIKGTDKDIQNFNKWLGTRGYFVRERILFPIQDELGAIKGIETRALDKRAAESLLPKYQEAFKDQISNLQESSVRYKKFYLEKSKYSAFFFGLPHNLESIWKEKTVFLTEGIFDMISLGKIRPNCLSTLTANINEFQILWLKRYVDRVILLFDTDKKGKGSIDKLKKNLDDSMLVYSISLKNKDVNETVVKNGIRELELIINEKMLTFF